MKQKFFTLADRYSIATEDGQVQFRVEGEIFTLGDRLRFLDGDGREVATIRQRLLNWGPTYDLERHGQSVAVIRKDLFTFLHCRFTVDVPGPDDLEAEGDFLDQEYQFRRGGRAVAQVSRRWFSLTDTYGVEVAEGEDPVLILASAVVIDLACHQHRG